MRGLCLVMAVMAVVECARPLCARLTPDSSVPRATIWPSLRAQPSHRLSPTSLTAGCGLKPLRGGSDGDGVTVIFSVKCPLIVEGESLGIVGNLDVLGAWKADSVVQLSEYNGKWSAKVHVSTREEAVEYKYVRIRKDGKVTEWEGMKSNRRLDLTDVDAEIVGVYDGQYGNGEKQVIEKNPKDNLVLAAEEAKAKAAAAGVAAEAAKAALEAKKKAEEEAAAAKEAEEEAKAAAEEDKKKAEEEEAAAKKAEEEAKAAAEAMKKAEEEAIAAAEAKQKAEEEEAAVQAKKQEEEAKNKAEEEAKEQEAAAAAKRAAEQERKQSVPKRSDSAQLIPGLMPAAAVMEKEKAKSGAPKRSPSSQLIPGCMEASAVMEKMTSKQGASGAPKRSPSSQLIPGCMDAEAVKEKMAAKANGDKH